MIHSVFPCSGLAASPGSGGIAGKGMQLMSILSAIRDRFATREPSAVPLSDARGEPVAAQGEPAVEARPPFAGYDRLDDREVIDGLSDHSQVELEAVESYERSHRDRRRVLDKLRYMRGREPLPGYDALSVEEIAAALEEADPATIKRVRGYERKFADRRDVLDAVVHVNHRRLATQPPSSAPAYRPMSATSASSAPVDRGD